MDFILDIHLSIIGILYIIRYFGPLIKPDDLATIAPRAEEEAAPMEKEEEDPSEDKVVVIN